jgi:hypothetical protein
MTGKEKREKIEKAIKELVVPFIRQQGFKGSFPHFRRENENQLNLLGFQFSQYSSQFVVEISNCKKDGFTTPWGKKLEPSECRYYHPGNRHRLGAKTSNGDYWFDFDDESAKIDYYKERAKEVINYWSSAEQWWSENPYDF